jgi:hypothetical protein
VESCRVAPGGGHALDQSERHTPGGGALSSAYQSGFSDEGRFFFFFFLQQRVLVASSYSGLRGFATDHWLNGIRSPRHIRES